MFKICYTSICSIILLIVFVVRVCSVLDACIQCNSLTDARCATDPNFLAKECANSSSTCYTRILNGTTIRGCGADLGNTTCDNDCRLCNTNGCNGNVFPAHRIRCLQCEGNGDNSSCAVNNLANPSICPIYKLGEKCFIRRTGQDNNSSFIRGCLSSAHAKNLCVDESNCFTCDGFGCNSLPFNSTDIPLARDSAIVFATTTLPLILAATLLTFSIAF